MARSIHKLRTAIDEEELITTMVALDTADALSARIRRLLAFGATMTVVRRHGIGDVTPEMVAGLTLDTSRRDSGLTLTGDRTSRATFDAYVTPDNVVRSFGFSAYAIDGNATAANAQDRYDESGPYHEGRRWRQREMTWISILGGSRGINKPRPRDMIMIRHWNGDGFCIETAVTFDAYAWDPSFRISDLADD